VAEDAESPAFGLLPRNHQSHISGRNRFLHLLPGSSSLLPAGLLEAARITRELPGTATVLRIDPTLFERGIADIAKHGGIELVRQPQLDEPQICRLLTTFDTQSAERLPRRLTLQ
jgi:hypothetical protein